MPVHSITDNGEFQIINTGLKTIDTSTIKIAGPNGQTGKNDRIKAGLQILLDTMTPLADLPVEDSNKTTDPATNREFWDAGGVNLVTRTIEVTDVIHDGSQYVLSLATVTD